jgi:hypothetical protein
MSLFPLLLAGRRWCPGLWLVEIPSVMNARAVRSWAEKRVAVNGHMFHDSRKILSGQQACYDVQVIAYVKASDWVAPAEDRIYCMINDQLLSNDKSQLGTIDSDKKSGSVDLAPSRMTSTSISHSKNEANEQFHLRDPPLRGKNWPVSWLKTQIKIFSPVVLLMAVKFRPPIDS